MDPRLTLYHSLAIRFRVFFCLHNIGKWANFIFISFCYSPVSVSCWVLNLIFNIWLLSLCFPSPLSFIRFVLFFGHFKFFFFFLRFGCWNEGGISCGKASNIEMRKKRFSLLVPFNGTFTFCQFLRKFHFISLFRTNINEIK